MKVTSSLFFPSLSFSFGDFMGMYAKLTITIGPPGDEVKLVHMRPIETLNDIQKFPAEIRAFSMDFLDLENINPLRLAEKKQPLADRVKFLDD